ncbi:hypothetical protein HO173_001396 [Letharia columbiana]|uniref:Uncharacterized protein n=1 Tax=Letharia columbiana TaxID=112416 RepID=A0A8H6G534_9LECA|nr:uncharacterized protein HO173_001396 [Letharia columbiana]KAF6240723.1 hypothetical protein HO173_001396 [Letharia columbiana]
MDIWIYEYQPTWPTSFLAIQSDLASDLARAPIAYRAITHVGSTAVPGQTGKNVIDVLITVRRADFAKHVILQQFKGALMHGVAQGGYYYLGDGGVRGRWSFKLRAAAAAEGGAGRVERNVYVAAEGSVVQRSCVALRDTLRAEPGLRVEYGRVKLEASGGECRNIMQYATKKNGVVRKILRKAGWSEEEIDEKEAQAVKDWPQGWEI